MTTATLNRDIFIPIKIEEDDIFEGISQLIKKLRPTWPAEDVNYKVFTDGITNKLVACKLKNTMDSEVILVRIYGNKTDLLIDRTAELRNIKVLNKFGLAPKVYGAFENGLAYEFYPGVTLTPDTVLLPKIWVLVAQQMAKMHKVDLGDQATREPMLWDKIEQFLRLLPETFSDPQKHKRFIIYFGSVTKLRIEYERLKSHLMKCASPIVFAHNDLLLGNVIHNQVEGKISFIDYEYSAYNYQAFDIANHFNEFVGLSIEDIDYRKYPGKEYQSAWMRTYLEEFNKSIPTAELVEDLYKKVNHFVIASHFLWGVWSLVQYELSHIDFDFGRYAEIRLQQYFSLKDKVFKELS